jgi:hypothetical protein
MECGKFHKENMKGERNFRHFCFMVLGDGILGLVYAR